MEITLYRNCILSKDYKHVFDNTFYLSNTFSIEKDGTSYVENYSGTEETTTLERYLNSVSVIKQTITIDDVYLKENGKLFIPFKYGDDILIDNNITINYNYLSFDIYVNEEIDEYQTYRVKSFSNDSYVNKKINYLRRYCFIDNIEIVNDGIIIEYSLDVWSSYSPMIKGIRGRINNSSISYIPLVTSSISKKELNSELNVGYFSNKKMDIKYITGSYYSSGRPTYYYLLATIQYYKLGTSGEKTDRVLDSILIGYDSTSSISGTSHYFTILDRILALKGGEGTETTTDGYYYEITDFYVIPSNMNEVDESKNQLSTWINTANNSTFKEVVRSKQISNLANYYLLSLTKINTILNFSHSFILSTGTLANNYKRVGIGFYTHKIDVECNNENLDLTYNIRVSWDLSHINLYLEVNNKIEEISDDLRLELPVSVDTADVTQLQRITRTISDKKNSANIVFSAFSGVFGGLANILLGGAFGSKGFGLMSGINTTLSSGSSIVDSYFDKKLINAEVYKNNSSVNCSSNANTNVYFGLIDFILDTTNDDEVAHSIKYSGYKVNYDITDEELANMRDYFIDNKVALKNDFIYLQFSNIKIYGDFPKNIEMTLTNILNNGIQYYTSENNIVI